MIITVESKRWSGERLVNNLEGIRQDEKTWKSEKERLMMKQKQLVAFCGGRN